MKARSLLAPWLLSLVLSGVVVAVADDTAVRDWWAKTEKAAYLASRARYADALLAYQQALAIAPADEYRADTLLSTAQVYEGLRDRYAAIATYKRILSDYPLSPHVPRVCFRLGELYSCITLLPADASDKDAATVAAEMTPANSLPYFRKAIDAAPRVNAWARAAKLQIAGILVAVEGKRDEGIAILREVATLDIYDITEPDYGGPFLDSPRISGTRSELIDLARTQALKARDNARKALVHYAVIPSDPAASVANLRELIRTYPDSDIASMAENRLQEILRTPSTSLPSTDSAL